jgi:hypothetical protein
MDRKQREARAQSYIAGIRNAKKKWYAAALLAYWQGHSTMKPNPPAEVSFMASQAVRMRMDAILGLYGMPEQTQWNCNAATGH